MANRMPVGCQNGVLVMLARLTSLALLIACGACVPHAMAAPATTDVAVMPFVVPDGTDVSVGYRFWLGAVEQFYAEDNLRVWRDGTIGRTRWTTAGPADADIGAALKAALAEVGSDWVVTGALRVDEAGLLRCRGMALNEGADAPLTTPDYIIQDAAEMARAVSEMSTHLVALVTGRAIPAARVPDEALSVAVADVGLALDGAVRAAAAGDASQVKAAVNDLVHRAGSVLRNDEVKPPAAAFEDMLRSALVLSPSHAGAVLVLANVHLSRGDFANAQGALEWADDICPGLPGMAEVLSDIPVSRPSGAKIAEWRFAALEMADAACEPVLIGTEPPSLPPVLSADVLAAPVAGQVALYVFASPSASAIPNRAAEDTTLGALLLPAEGIRWAEGGGLAITGQGVSRRTEGAYPALTEALKATNEFSVEVLASPADTTQDGPARIVSLSGDTSQRNFTLAQEADRYILRLRTSETDAQGTPPLEAPAGSLKIARQHVVATYASGVMRLYVDGALAAEGERPGDFGTWSPDYPLLVGNENTDDRQWNGVIHLAAVYSRALQPDEVAARFAAFTPR